MLLVIPVVLVWFVVVAVIVRPFGVQMPLRLSDFRQRTSWLQLLTFPQYLGIYGVLCFGCGMFILTTLSHYLEWRYFNGSSGSLSESELLANGLQWLREESRLGWVPSSPVGHGQTRSKVAQVLVNCCYQSISLIEGF